MDYDYEQLRDERFQEFCQALLTKEERGIQCFPVGMPDGDRDATILVDLPSPNTPKFVVYQAKYVREPQKIESPHLWLTEIVKGVDPELRRITAVSLPGGWG